MAALDASVQPRSTVQLFMPVGDVEKRPSSQVFSALGCHLARKSLHDQQCQFLTGKKSLSSEKESNRSMTFECVRTDAILLRGTGREHGRWKQSIFSLSIFDMLVKLTAYLLASPFLLQFCVFIDAYLCNKWKLTRQTTAMLSTLFHAGSTRVYLHIPNATWTLIANHTHSTSQSCETWLSACI